MALYVRQENIFFIILHQRETLTWLIEAKVFTKDWYDSLYL